MDFIQILKSSDGFGGFDRTKEVSREEVDRILWGGSKAPRCAGSARYHIEVIRLEETREALAALVSRAEGVKHAPVFIVVCAKDGKSASAHDAIAVSCFLLLSSKDMGLICQWFSDLDPDKVSRMLDLKAEFVPIVVLAIGYPARY